MSKRAVLCVAFTLLALARSRPTVASTFTQVFDSVDSVELNMDSGVVHIVIQGIPAGGSVAITRLFVFGAAGAASDVSAATACQRTALLAMSKPGKYQFAIGQSEGVSAGACKLILVTR